MSRVTSNVPFMERDERILCAFIGLTSLLRNLQMPGRPQLEKKPENIGGRVNA